MTARVIFATRNPAKLAELRRILEAARVGVDAGDLEEFPAMPEVAETGRTFADNALLKARAVAAFTGLPAVADDSGLCVDALNGMPGVLSARWSGGHGDDAANLRLVLDQIGDVRHGGELVQVAGVHPDPGGLQDAAQLGELGGIAGGEDDPGRHRASASCCSPVSSAQPLTARSSSSPSSCRLNGSCSAVPCTSTKLPSPVHTTFISVWAATSSS